ncbi:MAG TPA: hypothetical protein VGR57_05905 [Ktedonobacterales bacterium]|nr:hypothetical protein [Ktedonobacterales bacterium]
MSSPAAPHPPPSASPPQLPFARVAWLPAAALLLGAGGGFVLATVLTLTRALRVPLGPWWPALAQAHGHLQVFGWAGLFVLGVALHFLPRLRGAALAHPDLISWLLGAVVAGLLLRALCQPLIAAQGAGIWRAGLIAGGALESAGIGLALYMVGATFLRGVPLRERPALWSVLPFVACALAALGLAAPINLIAAAQAAAAPAGSVPPGLDDLSVTLGLLGFLAPMALAMSARALPLYAGLDGLPKGIIWPAAVAYAAGLALAALGALGGAVPGEWSGMAHGLGLAAIGAVLVFYVAVFTRLMRRRGWLPARVSRLAPAPEAAAARYRAQVGAERAAYGPYVALVASAYLWAMLGGALYVVDGAAEALGLAAPFNPDAARHSLAVGFIALLICGVAPRMLPGFSGGRIRSPQLVAATLWLGNGAALLRVGSLLAAPALAALGPGGMAAGQLAFGLSGPVGLTLAIVLAINLWPALWPRRAATARPATS